MTWKEYNDTLDRICGFYRAIISREVREAIYEVVLGEVLEKRSCIECGEIFIVNRRDQKYCCGLCRNRRSQRAHRNRRMVNQSL